MAIVVNKADVGFGVDQSLDDGQFVISPSDTVDLPAPIQAIQLGAAGDITIMRPGDRALVTYSGLVAGQRVHLDAVRVMATGTTVTKMVGQSFAQAR